MTTIWDEQHKLNQDAIVSLITLTPPVGRRDSNGNLVTTPIRMTPGPLNGAVVMHNSIEYAPIPCRIRGTVLSSKAKDPVLEFATAAADGYGETVTSADIIELRLQIDNIIGYKLTHVQTYLKFLDGQSEADPDKVFPAETWFINQELQRGLLTVGYRLSSPLSLDGSKFPGRTAYRDTCSLTYRVLASDGTVLTRAMVDGVMVNTHTCPFTGTTYFNEKDEPVTNPEHDNCSRRRSGCILRYPNHSDPNGTPAPFGGITGLDRR